MKSFYINPETDDLEFDRAGKLVMVDGNEELRQSVRLLISTNLNEWFLDPTLGFDFSTVLVKRPNDELIAGALFQALEQEPRIVRVENIQTDFDGVSRTLRVSFVAVSEQGEEIEINEVIGT